MVPVCAGINFDYYFSFVDNHILGAGSKQPHNVTSLIGVMNGYKSDLKLGLPWQMVEIHEPSRIFFIIESKREILSKLITKNNALNNLVANEWVKIVVCENYEDFYLFENSEFIKLDTNFSDAENSIKLDSNDCFENQRGLIDFSLMENQK